MSATSNTASHQQDSLRLEQMFHELDKFGDRIPVEHLAKLLEQLELTLPEVREYLKFSEEHYVRNLVHESTSCQVLLICWLNGQRSQIHDHVGSSCGVKVIKGNPVETRFERAPNGMIYATGSKILPEGFVCVNADEDIHQISNLQADDACQVTLHIYSPPLKSINIYDLAESQARVVADPVENLLYNAPGN